MPRRTLRTQLTLLYAGPFLVSGVVLLGIPILSTRQSVPAGPQAGPVGPGPADPGPFGAHSGQLLAASALALAAMVVVSVVLGWLIAGRFLRPLRNITATARDISASNLHRRLGRSGADELSELAGTLDDLFARLEASFESQRHFVANAAHELRTPLTAERALLQVALADPDADARSLTAACQEVLALSESQEHLIDALLTLATSEQGVKDRVPVDLAAVTSTVLAARGDDALRRGVRVDAALAAAPTTGDPRLLESLVANLVDNALRHNTTGGRVEVSTSPAGSGARLRVRNTGPVIPPDELERLFQPFQRLTGQRIDRTGGHGLGLAIVSAIARAHGAALRSTAQPDGGLDIDVCFP